MIRFYLTDSGPRSFFVLLLKALSKIFLNTLFILKRSIQKKRRNLLPILANACLSQSCRIMLNFFIISALGSSIQISHLLLIIPLLGVISALPLSIGGLGIREIASYNLIQHLGVDINMFTLVSVMGYMIVVLVNTLGLIPLLLDKDKPEKPL
ncbi:MAG: hypothetical protein GKR87_11260 [Kiritimatiellae bacterium]|nr:hypothetical protein [Kiritimatiellia bacterium]